ncbi:uncharacterized protein LOC119090556 isoform X2 [Pollicipes pollicipes]|uniref:uncharacterized protein LOC119090556 isoform X2 n=1 Tax=Pollicipes pollicipes TaxID=41117 RepID=UPI0018852E14|nr:uncharacterized protein LOC119090556 isoform X2 [Pollicipes pollicipes]
MAEVVVSNSGGQVAVVAEVDEAPLIQDVKTFEELVRLEVQTEREGGVMPLLRRSKLARTSGPRCCRKERMVEGKSTKAKKLGMLWRCRTCRKTLSLFKNSFFEGTHLTALGLLKAAFLYVRKCNESKIREMMSGCPSAPGLANFVQTLRDIMSRDLEYKLMKKGLGGPGKPVVVDETVLTAAEKYGRAQSNEKCWVTGIYDVEAKVGILLFMIDSSREEGMSKIIGQVEEGSNVYLKNYGECPALESGAIKNVIASKNLTFSAPDVVMSNTIKCYFSRLKTFLRIRNSKKLSLVPSYLDEFMWCERHRGREWRGFIEAIQDAYPVR